MTQEREDAIVESMPAGQRDAVRARLKAAVVAGWTHIGTWEGWKEDGRGRYMPMPPDEDDLFGVPPGGTQGTFVP